jgi:septum formation protein
MNFILASASPRRLELLKQIGIEPKVVVSDFSEVSTADNPGDLVKANALGKGELVAAHTQDAGVVIAADTVVVLADKILGKPHNHEEAVDMLTMLSGKKHKVLTAVAVFYQGQKKVSVETTEVEFYPLTRERILAYVATGEPLDKAGAYGIQGKGAVLVKGIHGSYSNVVGLPLGTLSGMLIGMGVISDDQLFNQGFSPRR